MGVSLASRPWRTYIRALIATLQASAEHDVRAGVSMWDRAATSRIYERLTAVDALEWTHATVDKSEYPRGSLDGGSRPEHRQTTRAVFPPSHVVRL